MRDVQTFATSTYMHTLIRWYLFALKNVKFLIEYSNARKKTQSKNEIKRERERARGDRGKKINEKEKQPQHTHIAHIPIFHACTNSISNNREKSNSKWHTSTHFVETVGIMTTTTTTVKATAKKNIISWLNA